jgi:hypothetical protein
MQNPDRMLQLPAMPVEFPARWACGPAHSSKINANHAEFPAIRARCQTRNAFEQPPEKRRVFVSDLCADLVDGCRLSLELLFRRFHAKILYVCDSGVARRFAKAVIEAAL